MQAPGMGGPPALLSVLRVQGSTVEQLLMLRSALWMCVHFLSKALAGGGALWGSGQVIPALACYRDPTRRAAGF